MTGIFMDYGQSRNVNDAMASAAENAVLRGVPLCVELDGTLTPVNTSHEKVLAQLKGRVRSRAAFDASSLPLNAPLVAWLEAERNMGRHILLVTAADAAIGHAVAARVPLFDEVIAGNGTENLSSEAKRAALVSRFGEKGFDFVGHERADQSIFKSARKAIVVGGGALVERVRRVAEIEITFASPRPSLKLWMKAIRLHQWVKNILVFLPALLAHRILQPAILVECVLAFIAFGMCASSVYLVNDMFDLSADRQHPRKSRRAFASGALGVRSGAVVASVLFLSSALLALFVGWQFAAVLGGYYVLTWAYSLRLKRAALVDVITLAGLYTVRIIAGAAATLIPVSFWLLAFSVFIFLSLGFVKRYTELEDARRANKMKTHGRGYTAEDLPLLMNLGVTAGYCTVVVVALYINSADSQVLYHHHKPLWLVCPLLLYWISRVWLLTTRGQMNDDPVVFAIRDKISLLVLGLLGVIVLLAM